ncbi:uncharacterized protein HD556DRAFT_1484516 [Suillus plorans]|uniref:Uncharacterized protein n=1 Tax=Suillus plorans TaxID=116603 RepID=A0A9P7J5J6_9AGAM|nr:uncharacterized protein HD556DRAFT_1484516 [Suillus plorans]KAG1803903.1 hypothetical protein HD556DRAFT_1484516 [Suillus plorans]
MDDAEDGHANGFTFNDTSEFVQAISYNTTVVKSEPAQKSVGPTPAKQISPSDLSVAAGDEALDEIEAGDVVKEGFRDNTVSLQIAAAPTGRLEDPMGNKFEFQCQRLHSICLDPLAG